MKKILAALLIALTSTSVMADINRLNVTSNILELKSTINWKLSKPIDDQVVIFNYTDRPFEVMFQINAQFTKDAALVTSDKVHVYCGSDNGNSGELKYLGPNDTMLCKIKPGSVLSANIERANFINGAEGTYKILNTEK